MRPCVSVAGTRCTRCTPRLPAHRAEGAVARHLEDGFLDAAERAVGERDRLEAPARALDEARVHAVEIGGEERGLVAAGAGADLDDRVAVVERIAREERGLEPRLELGDASARGGSTSRAASAAISGSSTRTSSRASRELVLGLVELGRQLDDRREAAVLPAELGELVAGRANVSGLESSRSTSAARASASPSRSRRLRGSALLRLGRLGVWYFWRKRSTRPAVSTRRCLPVKNGWHSRADVRVDLGVRRARLERIAAGALHGRRGVLGMDIGLH